MTKEQIREIIDNQRSFFRNDKTRSVDSRLEYLRKFKSSLVRYEGEMIDAVKHDMGRADVETFFMELNMNMDELDYALRNIRSWTKHQKVRTPFLFFKSSSAIYPEPYGTALIISAWNFPFLQLFSPLVGAIAAGNTAVLKPSSDSPSCASVANKIIRETFPPEYVIVLEGETEITTMLLEELFDYIFFTGSPRVGKFIMEAAAKHLTPVTLELGGKSPVIIDGDAHIDLAAKRVVWGKYYNAGQICVSPDHVYVHKRIKQQFIDAAKKYIKQFYGENPKTGPDYGFIINDRNFHRITEYLKEGTVIYGGQTEERTRYIAPTIIDNLPDDAKMRKDEIFAPILPVIEFTDINDVIKSLKNQQKPLSLYYFSEDPLKQKRIIAETSSGGVTINDTMAHGGTVYLPFGGVGNSGMGAYHGKKTFDTFTHYKSVMNHSTIYDSPLKYAPYKGKLKMLKTLIKFLP